MRGWKELIPPFILFGLLAAAVVSLSLVPGTWDGLLADPCRRIDCFCEPFQNGLVLQPVNTYSNLVLALVGLMVAWTGGHGWFPAAFSSNPNRMTSGRACPVIYGATLLAAGLGSLFYHTSLSRAGEWTDLVGIYLFLSFLLFYNLSRLVPASNQILVGAYTVTNLALGVQMIVAPRLQQLCFGGLAAGATLLEALVLRNRKPRAGAGYLALALACFLAGAVLWALGGSVLPCLPDSPFPAHAIWHILAAGAGAFLYGYYLSERAVVLPAGM